jgi:hypothetical protein
LNENWVTVFAGVPSSIWAHRSALEARGIPTYVPDEWMKTWDPLATGAASFDARLQVPSSRVVEAQALFGEARAGRRPASQETEANRIAVRMGFASMTVLLAPVALFLAPRYFAAARKAVGRPRNHFVAIGALVLATGVLITGLLGLVRWQGGFPWAP